MPTTLTYCYFNCLELTGTSPYCDGVSFPLQNTLPTKKKNRHNICFHRRLFRLFLRHDTWCLFVLYIYLSLSKHIIWLFVQLYFISQKCYLYQYKKKKIYFIKLAIRVIVCSYFDILYWNLSLLHFFFIIPNYLDPILLVRLRNSLDYVYSVLKLAVWLVF